MKPRCYPLILATVSSGLLVSSTYAQSFPIATSQPGSAIVVQDVEREANENSSDMGIVAEVDRIAQQITVRIDSTQHGNGSGVIIAQEGDTYYVLTAAHVASNEDNYRIITPDDRQYAVSYETVTILEGADLAVMQFQSSKSYSVATLANYVAIVDQYVTLETLEKLLSASDNIEVFKSLASPWVFTSGFPQSSRTKRELTAGLLIPQGGELFNALNAYSLANGYALVYSNISRPGMSGGPILDHRGRVIGINTAAEDEIVFDRGGDRIDLSLGRSLGIPIRTFLNLLAKTKIDPKLLRVETSAPEALSVADIDAMRQQLLSTVIAPSQEASELEWLNYCNRLWRLDKYQDAIAACDRAIAIDPNFARAYYAKGVAIQEQDNYLGLFAQLNQTAQDSSNKQKALAAFDRATQIQPNFYEAWRERAEVLNLLKQYAEALASIDKAIEINPSDSALHLTRGQILAALERHTEAYDAFTKAIAIEPNATAYMMRSGLNVYTKDFPAAIADCNKAIELNPAEWSYMWRGFIYFAASDWQASVADLDLSLKTTPADSLLAAISYSLRGNALAEIGDYPGAIADFTRLIDLVQVIETKEAFQSLSLLVSQMSPFLYNRRADFYAREGEYANAIADYGKIIALQPNEASHYNNRGLVYANFKDYQRAIADYNKAIELQPDAAKPYHNRGNAYFGLQDYQKAIADFSKAIALQPDYTSAYFNRGLAYGELQDYQRAIADLSKTIELQPDNSQAYNIRGFVYFILKENHKAIADYNKAIELQPDLVQAYINRGNTYLNLQDYERAIADFSKAIELQPNIPEQYFNRGVAYHRQENYRAAIADYQLALAKDEYFIPAINNIGLIEYEMGNIDEAIQLWQKAIAIDNQIAEAQLALAVALYSKGERDRALEMAQTALELDKNFRDLDYLKKNLWGDRIIADTKKLFANLRDR